VCDEATTSSAGMRAALQQRLPDYMIPSAFVLLEHLPLTPNGKLDRKALLRLKPTPSESEAKPIYPRDSIETQVTQTWEEILGVRNLNVRDNFFRLGGNSLDAVALSARLGTVYHTGIPVRMIFYKPTIEEQAAFLRQEVALVPPISIIPIQPHGSRKPLFCAHPAGGLIHCYVKLARALSEDQPVYGLQAKGYEETETPVDNIEAMAANYIRDIREIQPVGPYQLTGVSMGAIVAYEMAQQLVEAGERVSLLALLDPTPRLEARLIALSDQGPPVYDEDWMQHYLIRNAEEEFGIPPDEMLRLLPHERFEKYMEAAKLSNLIPADVTVAQFQRLLYVMNINRHAAKAYKARPYPGRMTFFRTSPIYGFDDTLGWGSLAEGGVDLFTFPGTHGAIIQDPLVRETAEILQHCMADALDTEAAMPPMMSQGSGSEEALEKRIASTGNQQLGD